MASTTLRYEGSIAELRGCYVTSWRYCACARCLAVADGGHLDVSLEDNGDVVRLQHVRRSSLAEVAAPRPVHEVAAELVVLLGLV